MFAREQAAALIAAGVDVRLLCYGSGSGSTPEWMDVVRIPRVLSPKALRAGPSPRKPLADAALVVACIAAHRRHRFDAVLAHNGEAALAALAARPFTRAPVIYVAHTLLGSELTSYGPSALAAPLAAAGRALDRALAARADGVIALCTAAAEVLARSARGPVAVIHPGLDPTPAPGADEIARSCERFGLIAGRFALYSGNLDGYQALDELVAAARIAPDLPIVLATHAEPRHASLRTLRVASAQEMRALTHAAGVALLPRRGLGGFPIKLLNYMEASRAIVARAQIAETLEHGRSGWLLSPDARAGEIVTAVGALLEAPARARALGEGARAVLESRHAWTGLAKRTVAFAESVRRRA